MNTSSKFLALRKRLDILGYDDVLLGLDSAPLAQRMLEDLVLTTEKLQQSEETIESIQKSIELLQNQIEPLQAEAQKLMKENTQLHQELIQIQEKQIKIEHQASINELRHQEELRKLQIQNQKILDHNTEIQKQLDETKNKLQTALEGSHAISDVPINESQDSHRTRRTANARSRRPERSMTDLSSATSNQTHVNELNNEIDKLMHENQEQKNECEILRKTITELEELKKLRDDEITRLGKELVQETGRDGYLLVLQSDMEKLQKENQKLLAQFRVLQDKGLNSQSIKKSTKTKLK